MRRVFAGRVARSAAVPTGGKRRTGEAAAAEVGEPISCQAANERGVELTIAGEITGVNEDDDQVKFNWEVAQAVAPGATFSQAAKETLEETVGEPLTAVRCPDRIPLRRGAELRCTVE